MFDIQLGEYYVLIILFMIMLLLGKLQKITSTIEVTTVSYLIFLKLTMSYNILRISDNVIPPSIFLLVFLSSADVA